MVRYNEKLTITWQRYGDYVPEYEHIELTMNGIQRIPRSILVDGVEFRIIAADPIRKTALAGIPIFDLLEIQL